MRILIVSDYLPYPPISGDRLRVYHLIRRIARRHEVSLVAPLRTPADLDNLSHVREICQQVHTGWLRRRSPYAHFPGLVRFALKGRPLELKFLHSPELETTIRKITAGQRFDIVQIAPSRMAFYSEMIPPDSSRRRILEFHNVAFDQYDRISRLTHNPMERFRAGLHSRQMRSWEPRVAERFDRCIAVSCADRDLLLAENPRLRVEIVPNGVDTQAQQPLPKAASRPALLFIGTMSYAPCVDAALYFHREILPLVRQAAPGVETWIVGADPSPEITGLCGDGVHVTGRVPEVASFYSQSTVCIVPLRAGGGTRLKILEAMAFGRPVVSTSIGCEGLEVVGDRHLLVADTPEEFARQTLRLLTDEGLWQRIVVEARQLVVTHYDWEVIAGQALQVYEECMAEQTVSGRTRQELKEA